MRGKKLVTAHRRNITHIMEVDSKKIFKSLLPVGWVVRDYDCPDYGIDQAIEIFDAEEDGWVTSGEHLFIQIKSVSKTEYYEKTFQDKDLKAIKVVKFVMVLPGFPWVAPVRNWPGRGPDHHRRSRWLS